MIEEHLEPTIKNDEFVNHALKAIEKSLAQVRTISEGVALYCRNGNLTMNAEEVCLKSLIEEVRQSCLDDKKIEMKVLIKEPISLHANRVCLLQLFQNLLGNAVKHADSKTPVITLSGKKSHNNFYEIFLHNNGFLPPHIKRRDIFKPFISSKIDGAGLGLMICEKIVTAYKGKIGIKSSATKGTTVSFTLPLTPP
jgi:signal transduction histidine kinase